MYIHIIKMFRIIRHDWVIRQSPIGEHMYFLPCWLYYFSNVRAYTNVGWLDVLELSFIL